MFKGTIYPHFTVHTPFLETDERDIMIIPTASFNINIWGYPDSWHESIGYNRINLMDLRRLHQSRETRRNISACLSSYSFQVPGGKPWHSASYISIPASMIDFMASRSEYFPEETSFRKVVCRQQGICHLVCGRMEKALKDNFDGRTFHDRSPIRNLEVSMASDDEG